MDEMDKNIFHVADTQEAAKSPAGRERGHSQEALGRRAELARRWLAWRRKIESISSYLGNLKTRGKISVSGKVHPGVKIVIKDVYEELKTEMKGITFYLDNMLIKKTRYEEVDDETVRRGPDAYKAN
jgi:uncharacterized protein (DUF342 family)